MRTIEWDFTKNQVRMIDQRCLPGRLVFVTCNSANEVAESIFNMTVRGAPVIGVAAAMGIALEAFHSGFPDLEALRADCRRAARVLLASRPTAVNLQWAVQRLSRVFERSFSNVSKLKEALLGEALKMAEEDIETNRRMAFHGAALISDGDTIIHHCNTGALATVDWGTALGVIRMAHEQGKKIHVLVDETRPRLQGARLTAWELQQYGIPYEIICDGASGYFLRKGEVQKVFFGADRVAANGDVVNKIGSYMLALAAHTSDIPVYSVFPTSTIDLSLPNGDAVPIEERSEREVLDLQINGESVVPNGAKARNPSFDITPNILISALITENGVVFPPFQKNLPGNIKPGGQ